MSENLVKEILKVLLPTNHSDARLSMVMETVLTKYAFCACDISIQTHKLSDNTKELTNAFFRDT